MDLSGAPRTAAEVRQRNTELDRQLTELAGRVDADQLQIDPGDDEWTLAANLAHIAEFPRYFGEELDRWLRGEQVVIGRTAETSAVRNDAVVRAPERTLEELRRAIDASFDYLAGVLTGLDDGHLDQQVHNVKYGEEPLHNYLERYVLGHKAAHVDQLRRTIEASAQPRRRLES